MQKFFLSILLGTTLMLGGCLENTQEVTIKADGSGTVNNINDMSALIGLIKQMGGADQLAKAPQGAKDSTIALETMLDKLPSLSAEEKDLLKKGMLNINMNIKEDKMMTNLSIPFSNPSQIAAINTLSGKIMAETLKDKMTEQGAPGDMPESSSLDDYYKMEYSNGELTRKVDKSKYAGAESDEFLKGMKEAAGMGLMMKVNYVFNLPRPAEKAEGKNVKLSADKMKVTVSGTIEDFFEDPASLEFKIKY